MGILLAYKRMWCYSQRQSATGRDQCSSLGFPCGQWRQKSYKGNVEALNFTIQLWNALWRSICITDPGEPHLPRPKLVCVNPCFFSWLPVTLCIGNTATERGSGFIQKTPNDRGLMQHSCQGTQAWSVAMVAEWSQRVKECVLYFVISQAGSRCSTFPAHVQGFLMLLLPADDLYNQQWFTSGFQVPSMVLDKVLIHTSTCRLWSQLLWEVVFWFLSPSEVL